MATKTKSPRVLSGPWGKITLDHTGGVHGNRPIIKLNKKVLPTGTARRIHAWLGAAIKMAGYGHRAK